MGTAGSLGITPSAHDHKGSGVVATALRIAQSNGQGLGALHYFFLHHHLHRAIMTHRHTVARLNLLTEQQLGRLLVSVARPMLLATVDAPLLVLETIQGLQHQHYEGGSSRRHTRASAGQYTVSTKTPFFTTHHNHGNSISITGGDDGDRDSGGSNGSGGNSSSGSGGGFVLALMPGLKMEIITGTKTRSEDTTEYAFLTWKHQQQGTYRRDFLPTDPSSTHIQTKSNLSWH